MGKSIEGPSLPIFSFFPCFFLFVRLLMERTRRDTATCIINGSVRWTL